MYPKCTAKNILLPYPNIVGDWFNGVARNQVHEVLINSSSASTSKLGSTNLKSSVANHDSSERRESPLSSNSSSLMMLTSTEQRMLLQYYSAANHGACKWIRVSLGQDYQSCSSSYKTVMANNYSQALSMRLATFCPCPGGDSPSAKRMFDAVLSGCIPVILSHDFVWPFSNEILSDSDSLVPVLNPNDFAIRLNARDYMRPSLNNQTCQPLNSKRRGLESLLQSISPVEIQRLQRNIEHVATTHYSWYRPRADLPANPLWHRVLPDGGLAHMLVASLAERAGGVRWPACEAELQQPNRKNDPLGFKC
jgi:Exostosin family